MTTLEVLLALLLFVAVLMLIVQIVATKELRRQRNYFRNMAGEWMAHHGEELPAPKKVPNQRTMWGGD